MGAFAVDAPSSVACRGEFLLALLLPFVLATSLLALFVAPPGPVLQAGERAGGGGGKSDRVRNGDDGGVNVGVGVLGGGAGGARTYLGAGDGDGDPVPPDSVVVAPGVNLASLGLDASDVTMEGERGPPGGRGRGAGCALRGAGGRGRRPAGGRVGRRGGLPSGDGDGDGDRPLGAALLPGDACEAMGRAAAALFSLRL